MKEFGWIEGRNDRTIYRWCDGDRDRAQACVKELVELSPSLVVANSTLALSATSHATIAIPIVFLIAGQGFVKSLAHPGGNITGFSAFEFSIGGKWLQLLKELLPDLARVGVMFNPEAGPFARDFMQSMTTIAKPAGIEVIAGPTSNADAIEPFIANLSHGPKAGLIASPDGFTAAHNSLITSLAASHRLPALYT